MVIFINGFSGTSKAGKPFTRYTLGDVKRVDGKLVVRSYDYFTDGELPNANKLNFGDVVKAKFEEAELASSPRLIGIDYVSPSPFLRLEEFNGKS